MMRDIFDLNSYDYELPPERIAQTPANPRDSSNLLVWQISKGAEPIFNNKFRDIINFLNPDDLLILNNTRVIPARINFKRSGGGQSEIFLLKPCEDANNDFSEWEALLRPARKFHAGNIIKIAGHEIKILSEQPGGIKKIAFGNFLSREEFLNFLDENGHVPLPPYIKPDDKLKAAYQTVFAKNSGSVAAPTASLHFTEDLLTQIKNFGVKIAYVTLHVGLGTFRPVQVQDIRQHEIHSEYCEIPDETAKIINEYKAQGKRIIASGTTAARTLESFAVSMNKINSGAKDTNLFIYPGYEFKIIDGLITNFHLPKSSLIMLVSAFAGFKSRAENHEQQAKILDELLKIYERAIKNNWRFFSFGDAMFLM